MHISPIFAGVWTGDDQNRHNPGEDFEVEAQRNRPYNGGDQRSDEGNVEEIKKAEGGW